MADFPLLNEAEEDCGILLVDFLLVGVGYFFFFAPEGFKKWSGCGEKGKLRTYT